MSLFIYIKKITFRYLYFNQSCLLLSLKGTPTHWHQLLKGTAWRRTTRPLPHWKLLTSSLMKCKMLYIPRSWTHKPNLFQWFEQFKRRLLDKRNNKVVLTKIIVCFMLHEKKFWLIKETLRTEINWNCVSYTSIS